MRASIVIAAHNEGDLLWRTVASCQDSAHKLGAEIVVVDDGSTDGSIEIMQNKFPDTQLCGYRYRLGPSPAKDRGARESHGQVIIFLDAHCKPEPGALERMVEDVERLQGKAVLTPAVAHLDPDTWATNYDGLGYGYGVELDNFEWQWLGKDQLRPNGEFLESPTLIGCCVVVARGLYEKLWGFDPDMYGWGVEDVDFGVKCWLMGHAIVNDPEAIVGHRFQKAFTKYAVAPYFIVTNRLRMALKTYPPGLWPVWLERFRAKHDEATWAQAWQLFTLYRGSAELERAYIQQNQLQDLYTYAARFNLSWPRSSAV